MDGCDCFITYDFWGRVIAGHTCPYHMQEALATCNELLTESQLQITLALSASAAEPEPEVHHVPWSAQPAEGG